MAGDDEAAAPGRRVEAPVRVAERWLPGRVLSATPGERRAFLAAVVQGYARRIAIVGALASAFFVVDHVSKLIAAIVPPDHFVTNDVVGLPIWAALVPIFVVALLGNRLLLLSGGLMLGGTMGNAVDAALWPGGVPDFIDAPYPFTPPSIWNFADAFIDIGALMYVVVLVAITVRRVTHETRAAQASLSG